VNEFYRQKAAVPRGARDGDLRDRIRAWVEERLLNVVEACSGSDDNYRVQFSRLHKNYADGMMHLVQTEPDETLESELRRSLNALSIQFELGQYGWQTAAAGLCGAELEKILDSWSVKGGC
jgi:hypothetical protein